MALTISVGWLVNGLGETQSPAAVTAQPATPAMPTAAAIPTSEQVRAPAPIEAPAQFATDDKGFVNSVARCDGTETVVAIGRTAGSFVVICGEASGQYEYLGVRLLDDAVLKTAAESTPTRGFLARNAGVTYMVSPAELLVTAGDTVIKQEPMIEYRELGSAAVMPATR
ncbi:MAG TPA: hypothetical protein VHI10_17880 [Mycobacterium sp.]|nr:hypothetical protein [Mycobacterium sp.]